MQKAEWLATYVVGVDVIHLMLERSQRLAL